MVLDLFPKRRILRVVGSLPKDIPRPVKLDLDVFKIVPPCTLLVRKGEDGRVSCSEMGCQLFVDSAWKLKPEDLKN